jgi:hypothetical protein
MGGQRLVLGRARDIITPAIGDAGIVCGEATMEATLEMDRTIAAVSAVPRPLGLEKLVGEKGGGHLRLVLRDTIPELQEQGLPLYLLLDDISGVSLVSHWAWSLWDENWFAQMEKNATTQGQALQDRAGVCWGLREGNSAFDARSAPHRATAADGGELRNPGDPDGWHEFPALPGVSMRRARRVDVWREPVHGGHVIRVEAAFQDSAPRPDGGRAALHEYIVRASVDPETLELLALEPEPRVLPFVECPGAIANALKLIGAPITQMREAVLSDLRGDQGCTHLNDALRGLADVPKLLGFLDAELRQPA